MTTERKSRATKIWKTCPTCGKHDVIQPRRLEPVLLAALKTFCEINEPMTIKKFSSLVETSMRRSVYTRFSHLKVWGLIQSTGIIYSPTDYGRDVVSGKSKVKTIHWTHNNVVVQTPEGCDDGKMLYAWEIEPVVYKKPHEYFEESVASPIQPLPL